MNIKSYTFTEEELAVLREAVTDYKFNLAFSVRLNERSKRLLKIADSLSKQFTNDIRMMK